MKKTTLFLAIVFLSSATYAQTKTTEGLQKKFDDSQVMFFYHNTLRAINQKEDKAFDELIKDIEKMKFLIVNKPSSFTKADYKKITTDYKAESFDEIMTSRYQGKNFDMFLKQNAGKTKGVVVLVNDSSTLYVLDIVGSIALDQVTSLYKSMNDSPDIAKQIERFANPHSKKKDDDDDN